MMTTWLPWAPLIAASLHIFEEFFYPGGFPVREALMQEDPETFFITDHYLNYPSILVRLSTVRPERLRQILTHAWRRVAAKAWVKELPDID